MSRSLPTAIAAYIIIIIIIYFDPIIMFYLIKGRKGMGMHITGHRKLEPTSVTHMLYETLKKCSIKYGENTSTNCSSERTGSFTKLVSSLSSCPKLSSPGLFSKSVFI
jgi:hypothetical protein